MTIPAIDLDGSTCRNDFILKLKLSIETGETVALLGPNGAGKTTLLRLIAGLENLVSGTLQIDGRVVDDGTRADTPNRRSIGWVPQNLMLFDHLTVRKNLTFSPQSDPKRTAELIELFHLENLLDLLSLKCSGGQAQRVAIARALAANPKILLLDEPSSALDVNSRNLIKSAIDTGTQMATLVVTHDPIEAATLAHRIVILEEGRIVQQGTPIEIRSQPKTVFAASLSGFNLIKAHAKGVLATTSDGTKLILSEPKNGSVNVVIPPSAIALHLTQPDGSPRNVWETTVKEIRPTFGRVRVTLNNPLSLAADITTDATRRLDIHPGKQIWVAIKATEVTAYHA